MVQEDAHMTTSKGGKPADGKVRGTVQEFKDARGRKYYRARITYPDGERLWLKPRFDKRERAEEYADEHTRIAEKKNVQVAQFAPKKTTGETCDDWHERYLAYCLERGLSTVGDKRYRWGKWISPVIGSKAIALVTRDDCEDVRDALDKVIREHDKHGAGEGRLAWKTAANVWGELSASLGEACSSKRRDLRVLDTDPTSGVQPPETGGSTSKVYPYPTELLALAACEDVPIAWRELHVVAAYTYLRPGELHALRWDDVDLDDRKIRVTKAWDYKAKKVKGTKTDETREIPIEPNLLPLLSVMHKRAGGVGLVVPLLSLACPDDVAQHTREHFAVAGCARPRLTARSTVERHLVFRSWRDAGITWSIVRGDDVVKVQRRAGHKLIATTMRYIVEAENTGATFGVPFPPLPACLLAASKLASKQIVVSSKVPERITQSGCERRDLNPHASYGART
jgi:integrase